MKKITNKTKQNIATSILIGMLSLQSFSVVFADEFDFGYDYGSGVTSIPSAYGSGVTSISSAYPSTYDFGSGVTNIPSTYDYGSGVTSIPSAYGSGVTSISSAYPSTYDFGSGVTNIPSTYDYGSGVTSIPSAYGSGVTSISSAYPSTVSYGSGVTSIPSAYDYGSGVTSIPSSYGSGVTSIPSAYPSTVNYGSGVTSISSTYPSTVNYGSGVSAVSSGYYPNTTTQGVSYMGASYSNGGVSGGYIYNSGVSYGGANYNNTRTCPSGSVFVNNQCQITTTTCPAGSSYINGVCSVNTVSCPTGSYLSNGSCVAQTVTNTYVNNSYQTCWNGSTIPTNATCPSQYKTCANGTSVPVTQQCYYNINTYTNFNQVTTPVVVPQVIKFNNVVTSIATQITNTSGRCNGIGLIPNGVTSTGWFEYGETSNLGRSTTPTQIGSAVSSPFSNLLAGLKSSTTYYCRAVMQNQYGIVKGEIVRFNTTSKVVRYVKPAVVIKTATKTVTTKSNIVTCSDGSSFTVKSNEQASMLNRGEKLIALQIEKGEGSYSPDSVTSYKVQYKNLSNTRLTGVVVKVTLPAEVELTQATVGSYDATTHTLTLNQDTLDPQAEGTISITGKLTKDAPIGKSVVTTAYTVYTVPGTHAQDEVTAYVVSSIVPTSDISKSSSGAKHVIGAGASGSFLPNSLVEWLALIAIMFIIFILGRSIYTSYKEGENGTSGH